MITSRNLRLPVSLPVPRQYRRDVRAKAEVCAMTVCVATIFSWHYGNGEMGVAVLTASDRMITVVDTQYEPGQLKVSFLTDNICALLSNDYPTISATLYKVIPKIQERDNWTVEEVGNLFAEQLAAVYREEAVRKYLSPLDLTLDDLLSKSSGLNDSLVEALVRQVQEYQGASVEALIVGHDRRGAHIFSIDRGVLSNQTDMGFWAIGMGAFHARTQLMRARYAKTWSFFPALSSTYAAKRTAQIAPGVGVATDMHLITRDGTSPIVPPMMARLENAYSEYLTSHQRLVERIVHYLGSYTVVDNQIVDIDSPASADVSRQPPPPAPTEDQVPPSEPPAVGEQES